MLVLTLIILLSSLIFLVKSLQSSTSPEVTPASALNSSSESPVPSTPSETASPSIAPRTLDVQPSQTTTVSEEESILPTPASVTADPPASEKPRVNAKQPVTISPSVTATPSAKSKVIAPAKSSPSTTKIPTITTNTPSPSSPIVRTATPVTSSIPTVYVPNWDGYIAPKATLTYSSCVRTKTSDSTGQVVTTPGKTITGEQYSWDISWTIKYTGGNYKNDIDQNITPKMTITQNYIRTFGSFSPDYPGFTPGFQAGGILYVYPSNLKDYDLYGERTEADIKIIGISQPLPDGFCKYK
jgi:hypothetical protein